MCGFAVTESVPVILGRWWAGPKNRRAKALRGPAVKRTAQERREITQAAPARWKPTTERRDLGANRKRR
jgi:hypothetical protein